MKCKKQTPKTNLSETFPMRLFIHLEKTMNIIISTIEESICATYQFLAFLFGTAIAVCIDAITFIQKRQIGINVKVRIPILGCLVFIHVIFIKLKCRGKLNENIQLKPSSRNPSYVTKHTDPKNKKRSNKCEQTSAKMGSSGKRLTEISRCDTTPNIRFIKLSNRR